MSLQKNPFKSNLKNIENQLLIYMKNDIIFFSYFKTFHHPTKGGKLMKKKSLFSILLMLGLLTVITGCQILSDMVEIENKTKYDKEFLNHSAINDIKLAKTWGNHTFVPLNISGLPKDNIEKILSVLDNFDQLHPDRKIINWKLETESKSENKVYGIWIDHETKPNQKEDYTSLNH